MKLTEIVQSFGTSVIRSCNKVMDDTKAAEEIAMDHLQAELRIKARVADMIHTSITLNPKQERELERMIEEL